MGLMRCSPSLSLPFLVVFLTLFSPSLPFVWAITQQGHGNPIKLPPTWSPQSPGHCPPSDTTALIAAVDGFYDGWNHFGAGFSPFWHSAELETLRVSEGAGATEVTVDIKGLGPDASPPERVDGFYDGWNWFGAGFSPFRLDDVPDASLCPAIEGHAPSIVTSVALGWGD